MRCIFSIHIPLNNSNIFLNDIELLSYVRLPGWDDHNLVHLTEDDKQKAYVVKAEPLWKMMPEVAQDEKDFLIFCGKHNETKFLITRQNEGYAKFRLLHVELDKLQDTTENIIDHLLHPIHAKEDRDRSKKQGLRIVNNNAEILEKNEIHRIIQGRVVTDSFKEAKAVNGKNFNIALF